MSHQIVVLGSIKLMLHVCSKHVLLCDNNYCKNYQLSRKKITP